MKILGKIPLYFYAIILMIFVSVTYGSPHRWNEYGHYRHYPQNSYPRYNQQNIGVSQEDVEWVCTNPKTKDMMVIASETVPVRVNVNEGPSQWPQPNQPQPQQPVNNQPIYVQPMNPQPQPSTNEQIYPMYETTRRPNSLVIVESTTKRQEPVQDPVNVNGDGLIDIRVGP